MEPVCRVSDAQIGVLSSASIAVTGTPNPSFFAPPSYLPLWWMPITSPVSRSMIGPPATPAIVQHSYVSFVASSVDDANTANGTRPAFLLNYTVNGAPYVRNRDVIGRVEVSVPAAV